MGDIYVNLQVPVFMWGLFFIGYWDTGRVIYVNGILVNTNALYKWTNEI